jgi:HAD superfamily hydrolase (TIGR01549 family)
MTSNLDYTNIFEIKIMVFDFDGVIIDSTEIKIDEYRNLFSQFTKNKATLNEIINIYKNSAGIPRETTLKKVFKEALAKTISNQEVENLSSDFSKQIFRRLETIEPLKGFLKYLAIHKETSKYIISGAPNSDISYLIKKLNLSKYFKSIKGGPLNKKNEIANIRKLEKVKAQDIVYFGDQKNDYIAATSAGVGFIGINAGSNLDAVECKKFSDFEKLTAYEMAGRL